MVTPTPNRIASLDLLKGLVMVIMALDHVRDYFHHAAYLYDPADPLQSNLPTFFTRWVTHFCAPAFSLLCGLSAYLVGRRKSKNDLSVFLLKRGAWLVLVEWTLVNFGWTFNWHFPGVDLATIWSLGISMMVLALLVRLPRNAVLAFSLLLIFGHNLLDQLHFPGNILWAILHKQDSFLLFQDFRVTVVYPLIPWIGVMSLGYCLGSYYDAAYPPIKRRGVFKNMGLFAIGLFLLLRAIGLYGDPNPYVQYPTLSQNLIAFLNPSKYPPSLLFLLMTLGAAFLFLAWSEKWKGPVVNFFCTFGRVPFFYYITHIYLLHLVAMLFAGLSGFGRQKMILNGFILLEPGLQGYGFDLWVVYAVWIGIVLLLYPLCRRFDRYKQSHKEKWWLSYL